MEHTVIFIENIFILNKHLLKYLFGIVMKSLFMLSNNLKLIHWYVKNKCINANNKLKSTLNCAKAQDDDANDAYLFTNAEECVKLVIL